MIGSLLGTLDWGRIRIVGDSMLPALADGQYVLLRRGPTLRTRLRRGDIVVLKHTQGPLQTYVKRVVGLPNEDLRMEDSRVYIDGAGLEEPYVSCPGPPGQVGEWWMGPDEYFVIGDNRLNSQDSRVFGPVGITQIVGCVRVRYWPPRAWGLVAGSGDSMRS
ncbi:MAG: signal peptidase I [SAR202 cluster bacterium Io17-Chloro-G9]|nr:MAG: signal peptidase I [SAR202 cluster bacterium Io17-Chloro-G9]